jgi:hypothetical protein
VKREEKHRKRRKRYTVEGEKWGRRGEQTEKWREKA